MTAIFRGALLSNIRALGTQAREAASLSGPRRGALPASVARPSIEPPITRLGRVEWGVSRVWHAPRGCHRQRRCSVAVYLAAESSASEDISKKLWAAASE